MKKPILLLALVTTMAGCSSFEERPPPPLVNKVTFTVEIVDNIPGNTNYLVNGTAKRQPDGSYYLYITPDGYPYCITHEVLHAFAKSWHKGRPSAEFCHSK